jgi:addiction module RelE/StbE family toxin
LIRGRTIRWLARASTDFQKIAEYYRVNAPSLEHQTVSAIYEGIDSLAIYPMIGSPTAIQDTRRLVVEGTPYTVVYRLRKDVVEILRIRHGARAPLKL